MLPIKDHNPPSRPAIVVPILIGICVVVFLFVQPTVRSFGDSAELRAVQETNFTACRAVIPYEVTRGELVLEGVRQGDIGGRNAQLIAIAQDGFQGTRVESAVEPCRDKNVWLAILTSMFLHGSFAHIGFNICSCGCSATTSRIGSGADASWCSTCWQGSRRRTRRP